MNLTRLTPHLVLVLVLPLPITFAQLPDSIQKERQDLLARMNVPAWHQAGFRGQGIKVAILDTGWQGYRDHLGKSLPRSVTAKSFRQDGNLEARASQHGILCAEVVHAIAPEAELLLANWDADQPATFLDAARWARAAGARVISVSVIMPTWSDNEGNGDGHRTLEKLLGNEALLIAAAGNTADRHWVGTCSPDRQHCHQWKPGETFNRLTPWEMERVSVEMMWRGEARYQLEVLDGLTGKPIASGSENRDTQHSWLTARFVPEAGKTYHVRVRLQSGSPGRFHLVCLGGNLDHTDARSSVSFPADGPEAIAVGAINSENLRQTYSACGSNEGLRKPDLVAVVPFPSLWRERPFAGTSAAAPQVAGLAALLWSQRANGSATQVRATLTQAAQRLTHEDHTHQTGHGQARLPAVKPQSPDRTP